MKKIFSFLLLLLGMSVATMAQKNVLNEEFNSSKLPSGWAQVNNLWSFKGGNALVFANGAPENAVDTLFSPMVNVSSLTNQPTVTVAYKLVEQGGIKDELTLLYRTSTTDTWATLLVLEAQSESNEVRIKLPETVKGDVQVAIAAKYNMAKNYPSVDYLLVENHKEATEAPTGVVATEVTANSANLSWDACTSIMFESYNLKVSTYALADMDHKGDIFDGVLDVEAKSLTGLSANTLYYVYVQYNCGDGDLSPWAMTGFETKCATVAAPFSENFESGMPDCFAIISDSKSSGVNSSYPYNSTKSMYFGDAKGKNTYFFLPELNDDVTKYQISFMVAASETGMTYSRTLTVGVAEAQSSDAITEVKTFTVPEGRKWEHVTISLASYKGKGRYIVLKGGNSDKENRLYVDDILVEKVSACPMPMFVNISKIASTQAEIAWTEAGNATEWNLVVAQKPYADPYECEAELAGEFAGSVTENPYTIKNLTPSTTYYVYVQSGCAEGDWTNVVSFTTGKEIKFPYSEKFDRFDPEFYQTCNTNKSLPDGWVGGDRCVNKNYTANYDKPYSATSTTYWPYVGASSSDKDHTNSAYQPASLVLKGTSISSPTATTGGYSSYVMMPKLPVTTLNDKMIRMWVYSANAVTIKVGTAQKQDKDIAQGSQFGGATPNITELNDIALTGSTEWQLVELPLTKWTAAKGDFITIWLLPGTATPTVYVDDIEVLDAPSCMAVKGLKAEVLDANNIQLSWEENLNATSWKVKVSTTELADPATDAADVVITTVSAQTYKVTGLTPNTTYYLYVTPACGDDWKMVSVTTERKDGLMVPYYNDFSTETAGASATRGPLGWYLGNTHQSGALGTQTNIPYVYNTAWSPTPAGVEKPSLYFYHTNGTTATTYWGAYAIMPELVNANMNELVMNFWGFYNSTTTTANYAAKAGGPFGVLRIGVVEDPKNIATDFSNVTKVADIRCAAGKVGEKFTVDFSGYKGTGKYIIFYSDTAKYNYFMLDNLTITKSTDPQAVSDLAISAINQNGATIAWKENGKATKWNVKVFEKAAEDPDAETPVVEYLGVTAKSQVITGLKHSTEYYVYVQSSQDNGNGMWVSTSFYTECGEWTLPFLETFEQYKTGGASSNTLHPCYGVDHSTAANYPYVRLYTGSSISINHTTGEKSGNIFYMTASSSKKVCQLELPKFNKQVNKLQLTVYATSSSSYVGDNAITYIGVVTSDGVFHQVAEKTLTAAKVWEEWFVDFSVYDGADGVIAIRQDYDMTAKAKTQYIFLDDILVEEIPLCSKVATVEIGNITDGGAKIDWVKAADETAWNLKVSTTELDDPDAATADGFDGQVTTNSKTLTDLLDNQNYYVYVQSVNPAKDCVGAWSTVRTFKTLCKAQALPLYLDFEEYEAANIIPDCSTISGDEIAYGTASTSTVSLTGATTPDGSKMKVRVYSAKDKSNYWALPKLDVADISKVAISMQMTASTSTSTTYSAIWHPFEIGVMTDPNDPGTFVKVAKDSLNGLQSTAVWSEHAYELTNYIGDDKGNMGKYIAIHPLNNYSINKTSGARSESGCYIYIDNIMIEEIPDCPAPKSLALSENWGDSVVLTFASKLENVSYEAIVLASADDVPGVATPVVGAVSTEKAIKLTGLKTNTVYYAYVRTKCSAESESTWSNAFKFRTECGEGVSLPFFEDFDSQISGSIASCWTQILHSTYGAKVSTTQKKSGTQSLEVTYGSVGGSSGTSYYRGRAVTPVFDVASLKDVLLYFDAYVASNSTVTLEAVSNATADAEVVALTSLELQKGWQFVKLDLGELYTSAKPYKQIRFSITNASLYIDNFGVTTEKNMDFPVSELQVTAIGDTYLAYSFVENTNLNKWIAEYGPTGFELGTGTQKNVTSMTDTIKGLDTNTTYDIYVKGDKDGSVWVGPITMTTTPKATSLPYVDGFEDAASNAEWHILNGTANGLVTYPNQWVIADGASCDATGNALYIAYEGEYGYWSLGKSGLGNAANAYVWAYRVFDFPVDGTYDISLKVKSEGPLTESTYDKFDVELVPAGYTMSGSTLKRPDGTAASTTKTNATYNEFNIIPSLQNQTDWTWVNARIDVKNPGIYYLVLYWQNYSTAVAGKPAAVDSIMIEEYPCSEVTNMRYTALSDESATVKWDAGRCEDFEIVVSKYRQSPRPDEMDAEDILIHKDIKGRQYTLTDLLPSTTYAVYVRTICPEGRTAWVEFDVTTHCGGESTPYTESFSEKPECWYLGSATVGTHNYLNQDMKDAGIDAETWSYLQIPANGLVILPAFDLPIQQLGVKVGAYNSSTAHAIMTLGVVDNTYAPETFESVAIFATEEDFGSTSSSAGNAYVVEEFEKYLNTYKGTGKNLAIKSDRSIYIKYVNVYELPSCVAPQQVEVTDIKATSAVINWIAGTESAWQVEVNGTEMVAADTTSFTLTGLTQGMEYTVRVRALCSADSESEWSLPATFMTDCEMGVLPILENFDGQHYQSRAVASCWENMRSSEPFNLGKTQYYLSSPVKAEYFNKMWSCNWLNALGDYNQLMSQDCATSSSVNDRKYKWFISPKMEFEGSAAVSFDMRYCNNKGEKPENVGAGRFFVIYSEDGGQTWTDATEFDLSEEDGEFHTHSLDLSRFAGKTLRVAFYHEGITYKLSDYTYVVIDNVRFNCSDTYTLTDTACEDYDYENNGFTIAKEDLPVADGLTTKTYTRFATAAEGCDSTIVLTLKANATKRDTTTVSICEGESYEWGGRTFTEATETPWPVRGENPETGCDVISYLTVKVRPQAEPVKINTTISYTQLPYLYNEANQLYVPLETLGIFADTLYTDSTNCQKTQYSITVEKGLITREENVTIAEGCTYSWDGNELTQTGQYPMTLQGLYCDTTVTLNLTVTPAPVNDLSESICQGTSYLFGGKELTAAGVYRDTIRESVTGRMTINELTLSVKSTYSSSWPTQYINKGDSFDDFHGMKITEAGTYSITLDAANGCDSVVSVSVIVLTDFIGYEEQTVCESELPINWKTLTCDKADTYQFDTLTTVGTDSIVYLTLNVLPTKRVNLTESFCEGGSFLFAGKTLTEAGTYVDTVASALTGCDSITTLNLTVTPAPVDRKTVYICEGDSYLFGGKNLSDKGTYRDTTYATEGCMEIAELTLNYYAPIPTTYLNQTICEGDSYTFAGVELTEDGIYNDTIASLLTGCDSVIVLTLNVTKQSARTIDDSFCEGDTYDFNGHILSAAGQYKDTTYFEGGCINVITTLNLTEKQKSYATLDVTICSGTEYTIWGHSFSENGIYTINGLNAQGCDSIVTLNLTIDKPIEQLETAHFCLGGEYTDVNTGATYTKAGIYSDTLRTEAGCDSIYTLVLIEHESTYTELSATICAGEEYEYNGEKLTTAGKYEFTLNGEFCDSIIALTLTVNTMDTIKLDTMVYTTDLPFIYEGQVVVDKDADPGLYQGTLSLLSDGTNCGTLVVYNVEVKLPEGINNITAHELIVRPNYIMAGEHVMLDLGATDRSGMVVKVYDSTGKLVHTTMPAVTGAVELDAFHTSGVYMINVSNKYGYTAVGRVVVR